MERKRTRHGKNLGKLGAGGDALKVIIRAGSRACSIVHVDGMESPGIKKLNRLALGNGDRGRVKDVRGKARSGAAHCDKSRRGLTERFSRRQYQKKQNPAEELDGPISSAGVFHSIGR
jgi:hypothetical protein